MKKIYLKLNTFLNLNISNNVIIKILSVSPQIFGYKEEKIAEVIEIFKSYSYSSADILLILMKFPSVFSKSKHALIEQLEFYKQEGLEYLILKNPRNLIQSVSLTRIRLQFLRDNNISSYQSLYLNSNDFNKRFKTK